MFGVEEGSPVSNKTLLNWNAWYTIVDKPLDHVQKQPVICVTLTTLALCAKKTIKVLTFSTYGKTQDFLLISAVFPVFGGPALPWAPLRQINTDPSCLCSHIISC
jgi:hypothetical protein